MGVRFQFRGRYEPLKPENEFIAYAAATANNTDGADDIRPIIEHVWNQADANREAQLRRLDHRNEK